MSLGFFTNAINLIWHDSESTIISRVQRDRDPGRFSGSGFARVDPDPDPGSRISRKSIPIPDPEIPNFFRDRDYPEIPNFFRDF